MARWTPRAHESQRTGEGSRVAIYARISDTLGTDSTAGVERQQKDAQRLASVKGWTVDPSMVFVDNDTSASGKVVRPAFERMLRSEPTAIITFALDRLTRNAGDLERVLDLDVNVHATTAGAVDLSTPAGRAMARVITAFSIMENEQKSARIKASEQARRDEGRPRWKADRRPFGNNLDGTLHTDEAEGLRAAFDLKRTGATWAECARLVNERGLRTTGAGKEFTGVTLRAVMTNPRVAGIVVENGQEIGDGNWEKVIEPEEWRAIIAMSKATGAQRRGQGKRENLLSGIVVCGVAGCGKKMRKRTGSGQAPRYGADCGHSSAIIEWTDKHVSKALLRRLSSPAYALSRGPVADVDARAAMDSIGELRGKLRDLDARWISGQISDERHASMSREIEAQVRALEGKSRRWAAGETALDRAESPAAFVKAWKSDDLSLDNKRDVIAQHIERIEIMPRRSRQPMSADVVNIVWHELS